jgi:hypothetical protein
LFAIFNHPQFKQGMAYSYGQQGIQGLRDAFAADTANRLRYTEAMARSMPQHSNQGGNVPPAQLTPWTPDVIARLIQLIGSAPRG